MLYAVGKFLNRTPILKPKEMDFTTGLAEIEADTYDETPPRNIWEKFWAWLVSDVLYSSREIV